MEVWCTSHPESDVRLPSKKEWDEIHELLVLLKPFKHAQKHLEGDKYCTAGTVCRAIHSCRSSLLRSKDSQTDFVKQMASKMLKDFERRWGPKDSPYWKAVGTHSMETAKGNRQFGIHQAFIIAAILDQDGKILFWWRDSMWMWNQLRRLRLRF